MTGINLFPCAAPIRRSVCQRTEIPKRTMISGRRIFFSPLALPPFLLSPSHLPLGLLFLLSPIFHCHKIKDGGYNNRTQTTVSPTQNTPALQAKLIALYVRPKNSNYLRSHLRAIMALDHSRLGLENKSDRIFCVRQVYFTKSCQQVWGRVNQPFILFIHQI